MLGGRPELSVWVAIRGRAPPCSVSLLGSLGRGLLGVKLLCCVNFSCGHTAAQQDEGRMFGVGYSTAGCCE